MVRVFVTGGTGRLGAYVIKLLLRNGYEVAALSRGKSLFGCKTIRGDLFDFDVSELKGCRSVIHIAGTTDMALPSKSIYRINVDGTKSVVEHCAQAGIPHIIFTSSIAVYGKRDNADITERTPLSPDTPYARSKFQAEMVVQGYGGEVCILRPSIIYGKGFDAGFRMAYERIRTGSMPLFGDGNNRVPLVHAADVANAVLLALARKASGIYNVNDENEMTQKELLDYVAELTHSQKKHIIVPKYAIRPALMAYNLLCTVRGKPQVPYEFVDMLATDRVVRTRKIRDELGFSNSYSLKDGISEFVKYLSGQK